MLGGWLNCSATYVQSFSCVPGSHATTRARNGFGLVKDPAEVAACNAQRTLVQVPPGAILVFNEELLHQVLGAKAAAHPVKRLFLGWRLTRDTEPMQGRSAIEAAIRDQAPFQIKDGSMPRMWARQPWVFQRGRENIARFSRHVHPSCLVDRMVKSGQRKGDVFRVCREELPSLQQLGLAKYPEYTARERAVFFPTVV